MGIKGVQQFTHKLHLMSCVYGVVGLIFSVSFLCNYFSIAISFDWGFFVFTV